MSYYESLGTDVPLDLQPLSTQNASSNLLEAEQKTMEQLPGPSDLMPLISTGPNTSMPSTTLVPMGPPQKTFMEKLAEPGPLGFAWRTWAIGAAVVAAARYTMTRPSSAVTPNRRRRRK